MWPYQRSFPPQSLKVASFDWDTLFYRHKSQNKPLLRGWARAHRRSLPRTHPQNIISFIRKRGHCIHIKGQFADCHVSIHRKDPTSSWSVANRRAARAPVTRVRKGIVFSLIIKSVWKRAGRAGAGEGKRCRCKCAEVWKVDVEASLWGCGV
jgi:hypothetical protein